MLRELSVNNVNMVNSYWSVTTEDLQVAIDVRLLASPS